MVDRYTDRAKKVMTLARLKAEQDGHQGIESTHILFGLVEEGTGVAAHVLMNADIDLTSIQTAVQKLIEAAAPVAPTQEAPWPLTATAKQTLDLAQEESRQLSHNYTGTEHLLLGLIKVDDGLATRVLSDHGAELQQVRDDVLEFIDPPADSLEPSQLTGMDMFDRGMILMEIGRISQAVPDGSQQDERLALLASGLKAISSGVDDLLAAGLSAARLRKIIVAGLDGGAGPA